MSDRTPDLRASDAERERAVGRTPDLRASDAERERAVEILRRAAGDGRLDVEELEQRLQEAYGARTRAELQRLVADVSSESLVAAGSAGSQAPAVRPGPGGESWVVSIMGGSDRRGHWRVAPRLRVLNLMGGSDIDLCDAELSEQVTQLTVVSIMGGGEIRVPDGAAVEVSKLAIMGGNGVRLGDEAPPAGAPLIRIRLVSIMGGSDVRRGRKLTRAQRRLRGSERRGDLGA